MLLHATMIAGLAAIVLPLVLKYLHQAKLRRVEWGAMMFFAEPATSRWLPKAWRDWTLTLVRMSLIASLALALAQPVPADTPDIQRPGLTVLIMDRSGSMSVDSGGKSRLDLARRAALRILAALPSGDEAAVVFAPEAFGSVITSDLQQVAARISDVRQGNGRSDLATALNAAGRLLQSSRAVRKNVFLISDRQSTSWRDMTDAFSESWRTQLKAGDGSIPTLSYLPVGTAVENCAVLSGEVIDPLIIAETPFTVEFRIANFSARDRRNVSLAISNGSGILDQSVVDLSAKRTTSIRRSIKLKEDGSQVLTAKLAEDSWPADDVLDLAVLVEQRNAPVRPAPDQNLNVGEPIVAELFGALPDSMRIEGPTNSSGMDVSKTPEGFQARFSATNRPGIYRLRYRTDAGPATLHFVVRPNREESNLADLSNADLTHILDRFGFHLLTDPTSAELARQIHPPRVEAWLILICVTVLLSGVEIVLSRRWLMPIGAAA